MAGFESTFTVQMAEKNNCSFVNIPKLEIFILEYKMLFSFIF